MTFPSTPAVLAVKFSVSQNAGLDAEFCYRLIAEVVEAVNIDPNIFVFQSVPSVPGMNPVEDKFVTVATPIHMQELPIGLSTPESKYMCRKSILDIYPVSPQKIQQYREGIQRRVMSLVSAIEAMANVQSTMFATFHFNTDEG
jgi:hypothetical protein